MENKHIIYVQANIHSISEVDTIAQTYNAHAVFKLRWRASEEDKQNWAIFTGQSLNTESKQEEEPPSPNSDDKPKKKKIKVFEPTFIPKLSFPNAQDYELTLKEGRTEFYELAKSKGDFDGGDMVVYDFQIRCSFREKFELENFPFDCQGICFVHFRCFIH